MQRVNTPGSAPNMHGPGKSGFVDGNPVTGMEPTQLSAVLFNDYQEEICNVIEPLLELDGADNTQLRQAIGLMIANVLDGFDVVLPAASILAAGIVKLSNSLSNDSQVEAATANAVKLLQDNKLEKTALKEATGTSKSDTMTQKAITDAINAAKFPRRTYQDVTAQRSQGVTYTNNTGNEIVVLVDGRTYTGTEIQILVGGVVVEKPFVASSADFGLAGTISFIVPTAATYRVSNVLTNQIPFKWVELR